MGFIQIIEIETTRPEDVEALVSEWRTATEGSRSAQRGTFTRDRHSHNTYVQIEALPWYEDATRNSEVPQTASFAESLRELCDGPPSFRNLDVQSVEEM